MIGKKQLSEYFYEVRMKMRASLERIDPEMEIYPGWCVRENIVHITGWDDAAIKALRAYLDTGEHYIMLDKDYDAHNEDMIQARVDMSFEEVLQEWEETRKTLKKLLAELSEEDLNTPIPFPWGLKGTIGEMLYVIAAHEREHIMEPDNQS